MKQETVKSISDYINSVFNIEENLERPNYPTEYELLFRGHANTEYKLIPSLGRYGNGYNDIFFVERNLIDTAKRKLPNIFTNDLSPVELLSMLQHYGVPTRLLDVTENALVALFFACVGENDKNGEVIVFQNCRDDVHEYPFENAIAESYLFARSMCSLKDFYHEVIQRPYFAEQRGFFADSDEEGGRKIAECCRSPVFVYGANRLTRQLIQQGRYILFPNRISNTTVSFQSRIKALPKNHKCVAGRLEIPAAKKKQFLYELKMLGISRDMLFADDPDSVCKEIKAQFFKEPKGNPFDLSKFFMR